MTAVILALGMRHRVANSRLVASSRVIAGICGNIPRASLPPHFEQLTLSFNGRSQYKSSHVYGKMMLYANKVADYIVRDVVTYAQLRRGLDRMPKAYLKS